MPMATTLDRMVTYIEKDPSVKSHYPLMTWSCEVTVKRKPLYLHSATMPVASKPDRMATYLEGLYS